MFSRNKPLFYNYGHISTYFQPNPTILRNFFEGNPISFKLLRILLSFSRFPKTFADPFRVFGFPVRFSDFLQTFPVSCMELAIPVWFCHFPTGKANSCKLFAFPDKRAWFGKTDAFIWLMNSFSIVCGQ
jgi:hypothetical protein